MDADGFDTASVSNTATLEENGARPDHEAFLGAHDLDTIGAPRSPRRTAAIYAAAFGGFLAVSLVIWWHVWSSQPSNVTTCGCGDTSLFVWFLEWPAYAISHGLNPFYSTALFHPQGVNLLSNTSVLAVGIPLAPITWIFGPIATFNVAATLGPALSALAMFWLLRRWVVWAPAAFVGGLIFGFSPVVIVNLAGGHLMTGILGLLPVMVGCLDELLIRQRRRAGLVGVALGLTVVVQFFLGTEILAIATISAAVGVVGLVIYAALRRRGELTAHGPHALRGLAVGSGVAAVLLAYPVWFVLEGPAHLSGLIWPGLTPGSAGITLQDLVSPGYLHVLAAQMKVTGGYEGPALPQPALLGTGMLLVLAVGVVLLRRDRRIWFFCGLGVFSVIMSMGVLGVWTPWRILTHIPLVENIISSRFAAITSLCAAIVVAIVVGSCYTATKDAIDHRRAPSLHSVRGARSISVGVLIATLVSGVVAVIAVVPVATAMASNIPLTTTPALVPQWFREVGGHVAPHQVILTYPTPFSLQQSAEEWQALDEMSFAQVGGSGPESIFTRAGPELPGQEVLSDLSFSLTGPPQPTDRNLDAVRHALAGWGVTMVVVPNTASLPRYEHGTDTAAAIGFLTAAIGRAPVFMANAWVWTKVSRLDAPREITGDAFGACTNPDLLVHRAPLTISHCVLVSSSPRP